MSEFSGGPGTDGQQSRDDVHTLIGAYALDAVDDVERARVERHLVDCPECRQELKSFRETTARLAAAAAVAPPVGLRNRVLAEAVSTRQLPPETSSASERSGVSVARATAQARPAQDDRAGLLKASRWLAAAASVLLVACVGLGALAWTWRQEAQQAQSRAAGLTEALAEADAITQADFSTSGQGTILVSGERFMLVASGLPQLPEDQVYKLWFIDESGPRPSVALSPTGTGRYVADTRGFHAGDQVAVTIEDDPDAQVPQGEVVLQALA